MKFLRIKLLSEMGCRYEIYDVADGFFGVVNESNIWNGIIGDVLRGVGILLGIAYL